METKQIRFEITPFRKNKDANDVIPSSNIKNWAETDFFVVRKQLQDLIDKNKILNHTILLLKSWNSRRNALVNYQIEKRIYSLFNQNKNFSIVKYIDSFFNGDQSLKKDQMTFEEFKQKDESGLCPSIKKLKDFFSIQ